MQIEVASQPAAEFIVRRVFDEEVDVAVRGVELRRADRAEDFEPGLAILPAVDADGVQMLGYWVVFETGTLFRHRDPLLLMT